jgi:hypothetical protein
MWRLCNCARWSLFFARQCPRWLVAQTNAQICLVAVWSVSAWCSCTTMASAIFYTLMCICMVRVNGCSVSIYQGLLVSTWRHGKPCILILMLCKFNKKFWKHFDATSSVTLCEWVMWHTVLRVASWVKASRWTVTLKRPWVSRASP